MSQSYGLNNCYFIFCIDYAVPDPKPDPDDDPDPDPDDDPDPDPDDDPDPDPDIDPEIDCSSNANNKIILFDVTVSDYNS